MVNPQSPRRFLSPIAPFSRGGTPSLCSAIAHSCSKCAMALRPLASGVVLVLPGALSSSSAHWVPTLCLSAHAFRCFPPHSFSPEFISLEPVCCMFFVVEFPFVLFFLLSFFTVPTSVPEVPTVFLAVRLCAFVACSLAAPLA